MFHEHIFQFTVKSSNIFHVIPGISITSVEEPFFTYTVLLLKSHQFKLHWLFAGHSNCQEELTWLFEYQRLKELYLHSHVWYGWISIGCSFYISKSGKVLCLEFLRRTRMSNMTDVGKFHMFPATTVCRHHSLVWLEVSTFTCTLLSSWYGAHVLFSIKGHKIVCLPDLVVMKTCTEAFGSTSTPYSYPGAGNPMGIT